MVVHYFLRTFILSYSFLGLGVLGIAPAFAQANILRECDSKYRAAKVANELAGQNWQEYLKACRTKMTEGSKPADTMAPEQPQKSDETAPDRRAMKEMMDIGRRSGRASGSPTTPNRGKPFLREDYERGNLGSGAYAM